jgi:hypothetical protein
VTLYIGACIASLERIPAEVERLASDLIELSTRYNFAFWLPGANVLRGWARSATGDKVEGAVGFRQNKIITRLRSDDRGQYENGLTLIENLESSRPPRARVCVNSRFLGAPEKGGALSLAQSSQRS